MEVEVMVDVTVPRVKKVELLVAEVIVDVTVATAAPLRELVEVEVIVVKAVLVVVPVVVMVLVVVKVVLDVLEQAGVVLELEDDDEDDNNDEVRATLLELETLDKLDWMLEATEEALEAALVGLVEVLDVAVLELAAALEVAAEEVEAVAAWAVIAIAVAPGGMVWNAANTVPALIANSAVPAELMEKLWLVHVKGLLENVVSIDPPAPAMNC